MKINFKAFPVYTSIKKDVSNPIDLSVAIANTIYTTVPGVVAHSLALRIYEQGEVELNDDEVAVLMEVASTFVGVLADSIKDNLK